MAGRTVGHIEVTVDARTNKLKAQLVKAGTEAGIASRKAIQKQLADIEASIDLNDAKVNEKARLLAKQIEAKLKRIPVDVDLTKATATLARWRSIEEANDLALRLALSETDVARVSAELSAMTEEQREIFFKSRLDKTSKAAVEAEMERIEAAAHTIEILAELDDDVAEARLEQLERERRQVRILAEVDLHRATAELEAWESEQRRIDFDAHLNTGFARTDWSTFKASVEAQSVDIKTKLDMEEAVAEAHADIAILQREDVKIPTDVDLTKARAAIALFRTVQSQDDIDIKINLDVDALDAALARLEAKAAAGGGSVGEIAGDAAGKGFGAGWSSWLFDNQKLITAAVGLLGPDIAIALEGALGAAVSVASSAFSAIGGAIGGLIPLLAGLVPATASVVVGFQGMGDALGGVTKEFAAAVKEGRNFDFTAAGIQDALRGLAPEAQRFVAAFADIFPQLDKIRQAVQGEMFRSLDVALNQLSTTTIPDVGKALEIAARSVNTLFRKFADASQNIDFSGLMEGLQPAIDAMGDAMVSLFRSFEPLIRAATPAARELADSFRTAADNLREMIERGEASERLTDFFNEGIDSLKVWWELIRNVGDALFTVFEAGKASGDGFVQSLADIVARFDAWLESTEGQDALIEFFDTGARVMKAMVPILEGLQGLFAELVTPDSITRMESLTDALGRVLPFLGQILDVVGRVGILSTFIEALARIGEALQPAIPALDRLADALGTILVGAIDALTPLVEGLGPLIGQVADALTPLAKPLVEIAQHILELVTPHVLDVLGAFVDVLTDLSPLVVDLLEAWMPLIDVALMPLITALQIATPLLELTGEILTALKPIFDALVPVIEVFAEVLALINKPLEMLGNFAESTGITLGDLANPATAAGKAIHNLFTEDVQGASVIADEAAAKSENLARKIQLIVGAAEVAGVALEAEARLALASGENLGGFAANAELAAEAQDYFNEIAAEADASGIIEVADSIDVMEESATKAKDSADALRESWDLLFGAAQRSQEASDAFAAAINDVSKRVEEHAQAQKDLADAVDESRTKQVETAEKLEEAEAKLAEVRADPEATADDIVKAENDVADAQRDVTQARKDGTQAIADAQKALKEHELTLKGNSEAALENRDLLFGMMDAAIADAAALKENKASTQEVAEALEQHRRAMIRQAMQLGATREEAKAFVDQLNLTPSNIDTLITAAGLNEAQRGVEQFKLTIEGVDGKEVVVNTRAEGVEAVMLGLDGIKGTTDDINKKTAKLVVGTEGIPHSKEELQSIIDKANEIDGKVSTVTVNTVFQQFQGVRANAGANVPQQHGGFTRYGATNWAGEAGSEFVRFGQRVGLVHGPTVLPGGVRVTSTIRSEKLMRDFIAAAARGGVSGPSKQVINHMNITPLAADPAAVATQVLNRAAVLAAR